MPQLQHQIIIIWQETTTTTTANSNEEKTVSVCSACYSNESQHLATVKVVVGHISIPSTVVIHRGVLFRQKITLHSFAFLHRVALSEKCHQRQAQNVIIIQPANQPNQKWLSSLRVSCCPGRGVRLEGGRYAAAIHCSQINGFSWRGCLTSCSLSRTGLAPQPKTADDADAAAAVGHKWVRKIARDCWLDGYKKLLTNRSKPICTPPPPLPLSIGLEIWHPLSASTLSSVSHPLCCCYFGCCCCCWYWRGNRDLGLQCARVCGLIVVSHFARDLIDSGKSAI